MKTPHDPRHINRIRRMQSLFAYSFQNEQNENATVRLAPIAKHLRRIDSIIAKSAPAFPVEKIAKVDLAILRLAVYELIMLKKNPPKVIIDEAVELAKAFGGDTSSAFVNGVLGSIFAKEKPHGNKTH